MDLNIKLIFYTWPVQDVKAHFSELLRSSIIKGKQNITLRERRGCFSSYCREATFTKLTIVQRKVMAS